VPGPDLHARRRRRPPPRSQRGFVLALTLLTLAIIAVVLGYLFERTLAEVQIAQARNDKLTAILGVVDTQAEVVYRMMVNPMTFAGLGVTGSEIRLDDTLYRGDRGTFVRLQDARGLFNLNFASDDRWQRLLRETGVPQADVQSLIDALSDYIDTDSLRRLAGAEAADYAAAGMAPPRNGLLGTPMELRNVMGWPQRAELWQPRSVESLVSTARVAGLNPNTAPREVLLTVPGITPEAAQLLLELRKTQTVDASALIRFGGADAQYLLFNVFPLPSETVRVTHLAPRARWAMRYSVTLTPRDSLAPWRIDYAYRIERSDGEEPPADDRSTPAFPARRATPPSEMPNLLAPFLGG
jgi:general secretion pathway protein K